MRKLPLSITPDKIAEAVIEFRFVPKIPGEAIYGHTYNKLQSEFKEYEKLDIVQLPEFIRAQELSLRFQPYYRSKKDDYTFQFGPQVISLINKGKYQGWSSYFSYFKNIIGSLSYIEIIDKVVRVGLRYINVFEKEKIIDISTLELTLNKNRIDTNRFILNTTIEEGDFKKMLKISNNTIFKLDKEKVQCSVIDIDVYQEFDRIINIEELCKIIDELHIKEKESFFSLLKDEYIKSLNPVYEEIK